MKPSISLVITVLIAAISNFAVSKKNPTRGPDKEESKPCRKKDTPDDVVLDCEKEIFSDALDQSAYETASLGTYLYDLSTDPYETTNLLQDPDASTDYAELIDYFSGRLNHWSKRMKDPEIPTEENDKYALFRTNGGYCAFTELDFEPLDIEVKYNYDHAPHIVFVLVDDWGYNDVGYRSTYMNWSTPTIDALAYDGIRLENHFSYELCTPTRGALLTGRYSLRLGQWNENLGELPLNETTLAQELQSAGYRTYMVGKWDLGYSTKQHYPVARGFNNFYGFYSGMIDYYNKTFLGYLDLQSNHNLVTDPDELSDDLHTGYLFQSKAEEMISDHAENYPDQPMFLYYATQLIHGPWSAPPEFLARCADPLTSSPDMDETKAKNLQNYCALNVMFDEVISNLTCTLNAKGMLDNTILVIVSDNGGDQMVSGNSYPFKGHKGSVFRGGTSTTAIMYSKLIEDRAKGSIYNGYVHITDWLPTLMGRATNGEWSGKSYRGGDIDGVDIWNAVMSSDTSLGRDEIVYYVTSDQSSSVIQYGNYKYFFNQNDQFTDDPAYYFTHDMDHDLSHKYCVLPKLVVRSAAVEVPEFTDSFLSFGMPLVPQKPRGHALLAMVAVTIAVLLVLTLRIYAYSKHTRDPMATIKSMHRMRDRQISRKNPEMNPEALGYQAI